MRKNKLKHEFSEIKLPRNQMGVTTVEFAIVGLIFFVAVFLVLELGRVMFTFNQLTNLSRSTARLAAVCPVEESDIIKVAAKEASVLNNLSNDNILIEYLDGDMDVLDPQLDADFPRIKVVRSSIVGYEHTLYLPLFYQTLSFSGFQTVMPSESLGVLPIVAAGGDFSCG